MLASRLLRAAGVERLYVDDVFSAYTYTGNGSTQTITNGIDLAGKGGMVWIKDRNNSYGHRLFDTARGAAFTLKTDTTTASTNDTVNSITATSSGFQAASGGAADSVTNNGNPYASWTFRKGPKFFDIVTYAGNGVAGRQISHALGIAPGMMLVKRTDTSAAWQIYHQSLGNGYALNFDTAASVASSLWDYTTPSSSAFTVSASSGVNATGGTYVAYLFAHDTGPDGLIQCGSFTADAGGLYNVNLGWEPQFLLTKFDAVDNWRIFDSSRGWTTSNSQAELKPNTTTAEIAQNGYAQPTATGFKDNGSIGAGQKVFYLAIRRSNKPPTLGTQVYNSIARTGTGAAATVTGVGFAPDLVVAKNRDNTYNNTWMSRLQGGMREICSDLTAAESTATASFASFDMDGVSASSGIGGSVNRSGLTYINHFFKRAPGVFDVVCYTGTGVAKTEAHNLGAVPELMIVKKRSNATLSQWNVYAASIGTASILWLHDTAAKFNESGIFNTTTPTASVFSVGAISYSNESAATYVAYLFATKPGISKVGSYTGNGGTQTVNCGFTTGSRFILIKRTDSTGDWYVWDTVRGIVAGNDPHLSFNTTVAEVTTDDSIDPDTSGFIVNQLAATNINVTSATYIFLAFA